MQDKKFKIYFYFCAMSFFVLLFIILYYSFGYKYNIEAGKTIQTGMIILKTTPKDVTVYNNGQVVENNRTITSFFNNQIKIEELEKGKYLSLIHISEPTRRTPISYAVFCLKK